MLTEQQIFDKVKDHLLEQNCQSIDPDSCICLYRGPNNAKCSIGHLIEDNEYYDNMERQSIRELLDGNTFKNFDVSHLDLLLKLQELHDNSQSEFWIEKFEDIKRDYFLN